MYGGLFGDLPSAKNSSDDKSKAEGSDRNKSKDGAAATTTTTSKSAAGDIKKGGSVLSGLGTAGTSMAFVPTAIRQRKRPAPPTTAPRVTTKPTPTNTAKDKITEEAPQIIHKEVSVPAVEKGEETSLTVIPIEKEESSSSPTLMEEQSDEFRDLHASVTDPYDPLVPNDLLAYWERKAHEKQRIELERSAKETLERQKRLREQLEQERQAVEATGDVEQIVQHREKRSMTGVGRGRGRGVSNLPAWLVQKQQDNLGENDDQKPDDNRDQNPTATSGRTVLLTNLTAPGNIDDDLAAEVQEECEETCGKVESVRVEDANPPSQPHVQVFVTFSEAAHAQKAAGLFHGRQFGQRPITAKLI